MDILDDSVIKLWKYLHEFHVNYIMIGGFAVNMNGYHRFTEDLDILIEDNYENRKNFRQALNAAEIGDFAILETMEIIPGMTSILLDGGMELDIFNVLPGYENLAFSQLHSDAITQDIEGIPVCFLHYNQIIKTKKTTNRPKDRLDIEELTKIYNIKDQE